MKIGIFDSGVGGLSVLEAAQEAMPHAEFLYYADTDHVPYGTKPVSDIADYVGDAVALFAEQKSDAVVLACNTATSVAAADLRTQYNFPIIGMEPAVKPAMTHHNASTKKILVTATELTLRLEKLKNLIRSLHADDIVIPCAMQMLVDFAEEEAFDTPIVRDYLGKALSSLSLDDIGAVVLGCTHFTYFRPLLAQLLPQHIVILDGNAGTVARLQSFFPEEMRTQSDTSRFERIQFYISGRPAKADETARCMRFLEHAEACRLFVNK